MNLGFCNTRDTQGLPRAFTIEEVVLSLLVATMALTGIISGYLFVMNRLEWSCRSLAAQSLAIQKIEQVRAARWDPLACPPKDDLVSSNFPEVIMAMQMPVVGAITNWATVTTTIRNLGTNPPLKAIQVDCIWTFKGDATFTNSMATLISPDQ